MRIAGRNDGVAKAIKTDSEGRLESTTNIKRTLFEKATYLPPNIGVETGIKNALGNKFLNVHFALKSIAFAVDIQYYETDFTTGEPKIWLAWEQIYLKGVNPNQSTGSHAFTVPLKTNMYNIRFRNIDSIGGELTKNTNYEILTLESLEPSDALATIKRDAFNNVAVKGSLSRQVFKLDQVYLAPNTSIESGVKNAEHNTHSLIKLNLGGIGFYVDVQFYTVDFSTGDYKIWTTWERVIHVTSNPSNITGNHTFEIPLKSQFYNIRLSIEGPNGASIAKGGHYEILSTNSLLNDDYIKQLPEISTKLTELTNARVQKSPLSGLYFKTSPIDVRSMVKGVDGFFYVADSQSVIKKYAKVHEANEPLDTGINFLTAIGKTSETASMVRMVILPKSVVYFTNVDNKATIYHAKDIKTTPSLVYEGVVGTQFNNSFGVDSYSNGSHMTGDNLVLASTYGSGKIKREVVFSKDGGATFNVVKTTRTARPTDSVNTHFHDVAIDMYRGLLWASEGDGFNNAGIHYSDDWGTTWTTLPNKEQPTTIIPYPNKIVFGRDGKLVGVDYVTPPKDVTEGFTAPKPLQEFMNEQAHSYFSRTAVSIGGESYMSFWVVDTVTKAKLAVATGDFGETWHSVWTGFNNIGDFCAVDDNYVYAYDKWGAVVLYSEKPKWEQVR